MGPGTVRFLDGGARPVAQCGGRCAWAVTSDDRALSHGLKADPPCGGARVRGAEHAVEEARSVSAIRNPHCAEHHYPTEMDHRSAAAIFPPSTVVTLPVVFNC